MELSILYLKGSQIKISIKMCISVHEAYFNSAYPDEISPYVPFHLGLHCLPRYLVTSIQNEKG